MTAWLSIIGIGEDGVSGLSPAARALVDNAEVLVGGERHLALVPGPQERHAWPSPFSGARDLLERLKPRRVVVLASGDPMWFGAGATIARWFHAAELAVVPHPGAFSLAAARLAWPLQECLCLTAHGRPLDSLALHFIPGRRLLVLAENGDTPAALARMLTDRGFGASRLVVMEHLGGDEAIREASAATWSGAAADLNTIAIEVVGSGGLPLVPGLPDDAFDHDGQLTKREIRAVTLSSLMPLPGRLLWDVGAGCGSVAIEWMRAGGRAVAIEDRPDRIARIAANAAHLGVPGLEIVRGRAPDALPYTDPDAVFVGGGVSQPGVLDACWAALRPGGRLVANGVTVQAEMTLMAFHAAHGGELTRLQVTRLGKTGGFHTWKPAAPVTQYVAVKG